jgi:Domain of unknown function (DUF4272)
VFGRRKRQPVAPDQNAVVDRALCIAAVAMLGAIAAGLEDGTMDAGQAGEYLKESHRWLIREQLTAALSIRERALLAKAVTEWTERDALNASWRSEALGVLLWALSAFDEMPPYDERFDRLPAFVPLLAPTADFRRSASLRSAEEIGGARDLAEVWHGRARTRQLGEGDDPHVESGELDADVAAAIERHYALNWLCGYASDWDSVPTETSS